MEIPLNEATSGMILDRDIIKGELILLRQNSILNPDAIERLQKFGIEKIEVRKQKERINRHNSGENEEEQYTIDKQLYNKTKEAFIEKNLEKLESSASDMVKAVLKEVDMDGSFSKIKFNLESYNIKNGNPLDYFLNHAIRVTTFSIILAYLYNNGRGKLGRKQIDYKDISMASLLHDVCYRHQDEDFYYKINTLIKQGNLDSNWNNNATEFDPRLTGLYSYCIANEYKGISRNTKSMILFSSEYENNSGPLKSEIFTKQKDNPSIVGAKIIHICSLYDNYLSHYINNNEELENVTAVLGEAAKNGVINEELTNTFINNIPLYPMGTKVILSTGAIATVVKPFTGYNFNSRPIVKILNTGEIINLKEEISIIIKDICIDQNRINSIVNNQLKAADEKIVRHNI